MVKPVKSSQPQQAKSFVPRIGKFKMSRKITADAQAVDKWLPNKISHLKGPLRNLKNIGAEPGGAPIPYSVRKKMYTETTSRTVK